MPPDRARQASAAPLTVITASLLLLQVGCTPLPKYTGGPRERPSEATSAQRPGLRTPTEPTGSASKPSVPQPRTPPGPPPAVSRTGSAPTGPERWGDHYLRGLASWYGRDFHGRKTANGEVFDMYKLTAAHRTLPMGTRARVWNVENGRSCILVVNDRDKAPDVAVLKAAKAASMKIVFSSGGASSLDESRLKIRLQAIRDAELGWDDFWVPGK